MLTSDPNRRAAIYNDVERLLRDQAPPDERERLLTFSRVVFAEIPDVMVFNLRASEIASRLLAFFDFVVRQMPPEHQLYRGLPGIHVVVRNPGPEEETAAGSTSGHHHEVTIVETHTLDAPFIFESLKNYFQREGLRVFSAIHPIFTVRRQWERIAWIGGPGDDGTRELYCQFRIERVEARERMRHLEHQVFSLLKSVFLAVEDHAEMAQAIRDLLQRAGSGTDVTNEIGTAKAFLSWLLDDNYVQLGLLRYRRGANGQLDPDQDSALGVFKDRALVPVVFPGLLERVSARVHPQAGDTRIVDIDYCTNARAVHHLDPIDDFVVREWAPDGSLAVATFIVGRLAKSAFTARAQDIPLLREKLTWLLERSGALPNSHAYREIRAIFNHFPKREVLYADAPALKTIIDRMVFMVGDDEIAVSTRAGSGYEAACIAFSDLRYSRRAEEELSGALAEAFGPISFHTWADCGTSGVLVFYFNDATLEHPLDTTKISEIAQRVIMTWEDRTQQALERAYGPIEGRRLFKKYVTAESRSGLYRETTPPAEVPGDLLCFEQLEGRLEMRLVPRGAETATLKLFSPRPLGLAETLRTMRHLGLEVKREVSFPLVLPEGRNGFLSQLQVEAEPHVITSLEQGQERLLDALRAMQEDRATEGTLNGLILLEGLTWREVEILRTLRNHLLQIRPHYNADTITGVLLRNSPVARALFLTFSTRFDPALDGDRQAAVQAADEEFRVALQRVSSLLDDEILRALANLVRAAVRTNAYQQPERPVVSIKVQSAKVEGMVSPRPLFEIYVHSRALEGIHLRGGKVARGGIRWSDRHDDFRTEVLGLMKTQMVKNSVIVPVGSKGGFVLKGTLPPRPALDQYLISRYRQFISGLLDVTDNLVDGQVVHPPGVVRLDEDDPYLVVAADKGTAHLSDTANSVSGQYGFWLGDAFASGGSVGYDHKKEGITARGAWECIKHSFRLLGHDTQTQPFTVAGVGDMSGDVFGNGMLRSRAIRLVAAFDHRHIFIDPSPDPERTFAERERLFALPRSSWRDYDVSLISAGGGVWDRTAKSIPLSPEVRVLLDLDKPEASGEEVIRAILTAKVDLFYNGGIGTYVKASSETDAEVGDRSNDRVRVDASALRARVVGEGGNLGLTQRARIEYWVNGGLVNTDAVDNSGGVDMSDHEVNLKILLDLLVRTGVIRSRADRNQLLVDMTDEVSDLVLADNANQARALSLDTARSRAQYDAFVSLMDDLVSAGIVNRNDDALPTREELMGSPAKTRGLPRPVLAVLLGHVKNWAFREVLKTQAVDGDLARPFLDEYFPRRLREQHAAHFEKHPLKREIIATGVVNYLVNNAGVAWLHRVMATTGQDMAQVVLTYLDVDRASGAPNLRAALLGAGHPVDREIDALLKIEEAIEAEVVAALGGKKTKPVEALESLKSTLGA